MMDIPGFLSRIRSVIRKSGGDDLRVLGRSMEDQGKANEDDALVDEELPVTNVWDAPRSGGPGEDAQDDSGHHQSIRTQVAPEDEDVVVDEELPSVNRRAKKGKLPSLLAMVTFGVFAYMVYSLAASTSAPKIPPPQPNVATSASSVPAEPTEVLNQMPPLVMPPPPVPLVEQNEIKPEPIPVQSQTVLAQPVEAEDPEWVKRKVGTGILIDFKDKDDTQSAADKVAKVVIAKDSLEETVATQGELSQNLKSLVVTKGVSAGVLANRNFMIAKGTLLDCALETAIDSSLAGLVTCRLTRDVYSDNGRVIMLDRGSQLVGEYKSGISEGIVRIFVLWTRAKTPKGVVISLDSPGTDALGRTGLEGFVDTHFLERFGAAIMMSLVQESFSYAKAKAGQTSTVTTNGASTTTTNPLNNNTILDKLATEQMKKSMTIPPVLYINQGANVQVMVVRDLDFSTVYGLEEKG